MYLALSLVGYDEEIKAAMAYVFGTTFVCDNMDNAKKVEIKSVFNILPFYDVGQKSWDAHLARPPAMLYFVYLVHFIIIIHRPLERTGHP